MWHVGPAQRKRSVNVSDDSNAGLRAQGVPGAPRWAQMGNLMPQALLGCSHPCPCPQAQPHPSSRGNPDPGRYVVSLARPLYGPGAWQHCTSPRHLRAQRFPGGPASVAKALMQHAGLIACRLSVCLCICLSSVLVCAYHLFICHLSIVYVFICVSIYHLSTYISTAYQLDQFLYLSYIHISIICLLLYLPPIDYVSIIMPITYQLSYPFIYLRMHLSSIIVCVCVHLCVCHPCADDVSVSEHARLNQSCPTLCDPMGSARQASLSLGFSRREYWSRLPCPPPGDLPDPGIKPASLTAPALAGGSLPLAPRGKLCSSYVPCTWHCLCCVFFLENLRSSFIISQPLRF